MESNMKKEYMTPQMVAMEMKMVGMLCLSGDIEGEATEPAYSRETDSFDMEDADF